jgi:hypothetical protein
MNASMRKVAAALAGLAASCPAAANVIGFTGPFAPSQWTVSGAPAPSTNTGVYGSVDTALAPGSIRLIGGDGGAIGFDTCTDGILGECMLVYSANNVESPISFHWEYHSNDTGPSGLDPSADFDVFGVIVDGIVTQLSAFGTGEIDQSGDFSTVVGSSFAFFIDCQDCQFGNAEVTVSAFAAPEPGSLALLGLGFLGIGALRARVRAV